jgi:hypothetical protein
MRFRLIAIVAMGLLAAQTASAVTIDGKDWRQLTDTTGFSWLQINAACGSGTCSGSIGTVSVEGWMWATNADVQGLFETLVKPDSVQFPTATTSYYAAGDLDIANAVRSVFDPTWIFQLGANQYLEVRGLTRSQANGTTTLAYLSDSPFLTGLDYAAFDTAYPKNSGDDHTGIWLYKPAAAVPEPGTLALFSAGAAAIAFMRRRRTNVSA